MKSSSQGGLVYSTETGRMCPACRQPQVQCACKAQAKAAPASDGVVRVSRQTKGRGGKSVTVVKGLALDAIALALLGKQLRT
ncbi:MAG: stress response translation initiation inhibitor YciH, partial [Janthinobacterium sp.]